MFAKSHPGIAAKNKEKIETLNLSTLRGDNDDFVEDSNGIFGSDTTLTRSATLPTLSSGYTLSTDPQNSYKPRKSVRISLEPATFFDSNSENFEEEWTGPGILRDTRTPLEPNTKTIYAELQNIHLDLMKKSKELSFQQSELERREFLLHEREEELIDQEESLMNRENRRGREDFMMRLNGVEMEVQEKMQLLQEHHAQEIEELTKVLSDKDKEARRIKNSFDIIKSQNDELKSQVAEFSELSKKLQTQNGKLRKRVENLQRKNDFSSQKKAINQVLAEQQNMQLKNDDRKINQTVNKSIEKPMKLWKNSLESLSVCLEWISESSLKQLIGNASCKVEAVTIGREYIIDKCLKVLPLLVEVIKYVPTCIQQSKHHLPYLRFIYWSLHHLENTHHTLLSSTARRLGEELIKPSSVQAQQIITSLSCDETHHSSIIGNEVSKPKSNMFFKSQNPEVRIISSLIILKTLHQVDMLAQVFDQLKKDLKDEQNREIFLAYNAIHVVIPYLTYKTNKAMLGCSVDIMLQMAMESRLLPSFLDTCSCETWFRAVSSAVRSLNQSTDSAALEKLSIVLQKLSKIPANRKLFESFSLSRVLHDKYRECDADNTFLSLNLRSILFNLHVIK